MTKSITLSTIVLLALATLGCSLQKNTPENVRSQLVPAHAFTAARLEKKLISFDERARALSTILAQDGDFAMKVLVENDRQAPLIARMAERYRLMAGWNSLSFFDSAGIVISSSPNNTYPASNIVWNTIGADTPTVLLDTLSNTLLLGLRKNFAIQEISFSLYATLMLDTAWIAELIPTPNATLCLKNGSTLLNTPFPGSIMLSHDTLSIGSLRFLQSEIPIPGNANGYSMVLLLPCVPAVK